MNVARPFFGQLALVTLITVGCGGGGQSAGPEVVSPPAEPGISVLAGSIGGKGTVDGVGVAARFVNPKAIAVDAAGNAYVADSDMHTIRKITPAGLVTTLAGQAGAGGYRDGPGAEARFDTPVALAVDGSGNVYVADTNNHAIRKITPGGDVTTLLRGSQVQWTNPLPAVGLSLPTGVAVDAAGIVYVSQTQTVAPIEIFWPQYFNMPAKVILKITPAGLLTTLAGAGYVAGALVDGVGEAARFLDPTGLAVDAAGNVYVADGGTMRHITPAGRVTTFVDSRATANSSGPIGPCGTPSDLAAIAVDRAGALYAGGMGEVCRIAPSGLVSRLAGKPWPSFRGLVDGATESAVLGQVNGLAVDSAGYLLVADGAAARIRKIAPNGEVSTVAGASREVGMVDGIGSEARFDYTGAVATAVSASGTLFVSDTRTLRDITPLGVVRTYVVDTSDRLMAAALDASGAAYELIGVFELSPPCNPLTRPCGSPFWEPYFQSGYRVRKRTPTGEVTNVGPPITFNALRPNMPYPPGAIAMDGLGNVYIADHGVNNRFQGHIWYPEFNPNTARSAYTTITKITPQGELSTLAGTAGLQGTADGVGPAASFIAPTHLAVDAFGNVYVVDGRTTLDAVGDVVMRNGRSIRKITPAGVVTTLGRNGAATSAGGNEFDDDLHGGYGLGEAVRFGEIVSLVARPTGDIHVGEQLPMGNATPGRVRKISADGVVTTVAGTRLSSGMTLGSLPGSLSELRGLAVDAKGTLHVVTEGAVLKIQLPL